VIVAAATAAAIQPLSAESQPCKVHVSEAHIQGCHPGDEFGHSRNSKIAAVSTKKASDATTKG
jgi:hypothetical protein